MKVAVVGATGMVGGVMLKVLEERQFPVDELLPVASARSVGQTVLFKGQPVTVIGMEAAIAAAPDVALFSAGGSTSLEWAPRFAEAGITVIDNSSAWRMHADHRLVVPEINADLLTASDKIIANPNCSTIQLVMALAPLHRAYGLQRLVISTYQSVTGTGVKASRQLQNEQQGTDGEMAYPYAIHENCLPHCDVFLEDDYTKEEVKLVNETRKILGADGIRITATCVRVPVRGGHSESVNVELGSAFELSDVRKLLSDTPGVVVQDNPAVNQYPMPLMAEGKDDVFVGRIRRDASQPNTLNMWVVSDNLRKGAATNAVQIAEHLLAKGLLSRSASMAN